MIHYTLWDIDNCLADDKWRQDMIEWDKHGDERYAKYNDAAWVDLADIRHKRAFNLFIEMGAVPVFFSGRPEAMREATLAWLERHLAVVCPSGDLFLRTNGTVGLSPRQCKEAMLVQFLRERIGMEGEHGIIVGAFDDIPAVVEMYRSYDIPAARLAIHDDLSGAYQPSDLK